MGHHFEFQARPESRGFDVGRPVQAQESKTTQSTIQPTVNSTPHSSMWSAINAPCFSRLQLGGRIFGAATLRTAVWPHLLQVHSNQWVSLASGCSLANRIGVSGCCFANRVGVVLFYELSYGSFYDPWGQFDKCNTRFMVTLQHEITFNNQLTFSYFKSGVVALQLHFHVAEVKCVIPRAKQEDILWIQSWYLFGGVGEGGGNK